MSDDYIPTTAEIRKGYIGEPSSAWDGLVGAEFDRWLAEHDRETEADRVKAIWRMREFAAVIVRARADAIRLSDTRGREVHDRLASVDAEAVLDDHDREVRAKAIESLIAPFDGAFFYSARDLDEPFTDPTPDHPTWTGHFLQTHVRLMIQKWIGNVATGIREGRL